MASIQDIGTFVFAFLCCLMSQLTAMVLSGRSPPILWDYYPPFQRRNEDCLSDDVVPKGLELKLKVSVGNDPPISDFYKQRWISFQIKTKASLFQKYLLCLVLWQNVAAK